DALEHQPPNTTSNLFNLWDDTALSDTSSVQFETTTDDDISTQGDDITELPSLFYSQRGSITSHSSSHTLTGFPATRRQAKLLYTKASQSIPVIPTRGALKKLSKKTMIMPITLAEEGDIDLDEDLREVHSALQLFLNSRMSDAEDLLFIKSKTSLYHSLGYSFVCYLKSLMTFEPQDIKKAISALKVTVYIASVLRKKEGLFGSLSSIIRTAAGVSALKSMSRLQRHAELVYAEAYLLKAVLSIFYDNSLVSFIREGINIRNSYLIYRNLSKFMEHIHEEEEISNFEVDSHFSSGVSLGMGLFNLMLSLLPPGVLKFVQFVGFSGDRDHALKILESCGGWTSDPSQKVPDITIEEEGIRRPFCDLALLTYHLIISNLVPVADTNKALAAKVLDYNLQRYPNGVLFLYFSGRLNQSESYIHEAIEQYKTAISIQKQWKQLHHICYWEMALNYQCLMDFENAYECFKTLCKESMWSKCIYLYHQAICLYTLGKQEDMDRVIKMLKKVPKLIQRIAGKSIPLEKFVARKARKFISQGYRLLLPAYELTYIWNSYDVMPLVPLLRSLSTIELTIDNLDSVKDNQFYVNYWDDVCLAYLLRGVLLSKIAFPNNPEDEKACKNNKDNSTSTCATAIASFQYAIRKGACIKLDHYIVHFARFELGRLYTNMKEFGKARSEFQRVLDGGDGTEKRNGKYSLESMLLLRTYNAMSDRINEKDR
ncbi:9692_t:CDS:2, partial [Paraglomus brasilianum]